jgi:basic amino acid/polyamine antiporter, APA family
VARQSNFGWCNSDLYLVHYRGIKTGAAIQNVLTLLKVGVIVLLIIAGFASGRGDVTHFSASDSPATGFPGLKSIGLSLMWIMFAYSGWNASTYIGAELKNPLKTLPGSLLWGTLIVTILYLGVNALFVYGVDPEAMKGVIAVGGLATVNLFRAVGRRTLLTADSVCPLLIT